MRVPVLMYHYVSDLPEDADEVARLIAIEDARFWWHPGVDPIALARGLEKCAMIIAKSL